VKMARVVAVLGITAAVQVPARAQQGPLTGTELYSLCNSQVATIKAECMAYLGGFAEGIILGQQLTDYHVLLCLPTGVSTQKLRLIVQKGMRDHPENLNQGANVVVATALIAAFKCKPGQVPIYGQQQN
jgi:Rap1a immunity proteins